MTATEGFQAMDIVRLTQNGQNLYTQGKLPEALEEFEKAHKCAVKLNHRPTIETCAYNLACAHAANRNGEQTSKYLKALSHSFTDTLNKAEVAFLNALAEQHRSETSKNETITLYKSALERLNLLQSNTHASLKKYILQELCLLEKDPIKLAEYKAQLAGLFGYLNMPYMQVQLLCETAELQFKSSRESEAVDTAADCQLIIQELQGKKTPPDNSQHEDEDNSTPKEETRRKLSDEKLIVSLNDLGLLFTQLEEFGKAVECFQQALDIIAREDHESGHKAILLQNIGAVYNFMLARDERYVQKALEYHQKAIDQYEEHNNSQGLSYCYLNKAYAEFIKQDFTSVQEAYLVALHKARERTGKKRERKNDIRTEWQALEGLGCVSCCLHDMRKGEQYLRKAIELVHQDKQDMVQRSACDRILEKLLSVSSRPSSREPGVRTMLSRLGSTGPPSTGQLSQGSSSVPSNSVVKTRRQLKVRKTGSLMRFEKVARGLQVDTPDLTLLEAEETSESGSSSDSETSSSSYTSDESEESAPITPPRTVAARRPDDTKKPFPSQGRQSFNTSSMNQRSMSSRISRRQSEKGLKKSLLMSSDEEEDEDDHRRLLDAYKQLHEGSESGEDESPARTPRSTGQQQQQQQEQQQQQQQEESSSEHSDTDQTIEEKTDNDADDDRTENSNSREVSQPQRSSVKKGGSNLTGTKSLRFKTPGTSSDEGQGQGRHGSEIKADVHGNGKVNASSSRPKSRIAGYADSESDSDDTELSEEDTHDVRQAPPVPTQSPPATMHRTYEKPLMINNPMYGSAPRESTGHYAEIEIENADSAKQQGEHANAIALLNMKMRRGPNYFISSDENDQEEIDSDKNKMASEKSGGGGEPSQNLGESTIYETIKPALPDRGPQSRQKRDKDDDDEEEEEVEENVVSEEEEEEDGGRALSRAERERQMMQYHQQHGQDSPQEEPTQINAKEGKSKTCVIS